MRLLTLLTALLAVVTCNGTFAQQTDHDRQLPAALLAGSTTSAVQPSGYFNLRLKSTALTPQEWLRQKQSSFGFDARTELRAGKTTTAIDGRSYLRIRQYRDGAPVLGGDLIGQSTRQGSLRQLSGYLAPNELFAAPASPAPPLPDDELEVTARQYLLPKHPNALHWIIVDHGDSWTAANPWRPTAATPYRKCRALEVQEPGGPEAEMVYVDLYTGKVIFSYPLSCSLQRRLHYGTVATASVVWREGDPFPGLLSDDDQEMIKATEEMYSLYYRTFGRKGHDGEGGLMRLVNRAFISGCPNARARGYTIYACSGVMGDDIVGHEWTHNYTTSMNDLLFTYESGALQEGLADIFGEALDLLNDRGLDDNDHLPRDGCFTDNYRWSIAEDAVAIDTILRDIWAPNCKTDPEQRYSSLFVCNSPDGVDIHSHSTVVSRTFSLLVDGDTTLTPAVPGIGLTKALHLFYHANANYVTRVTDFSAFAAMLRLAANDLRGVNLPQLTLINIPAQPSNDSISAADLISLDAAISATQLDQPSQCQGAPALSPDIPATCLQDSNVFVPVYAENWEAAPQGWTINQEPIHPEDWEEKPWELTTIPLPDGRPGRAMFAPNTHVGNCQTDVESGTVNLTSPLIFLPAEFTDYQLKFNHYYSIEPSTDGGVLNYRIAGEEDFLPVPAEAFTFNGYDATLLLSGLNDNPIAGREAFTGANDMSNVGSWGQSIVDLSVLGLQPGDTFQLQWTLGHDGCDGWLGWYVDEITIGFCGEQALPVTYLSLTATAGKTHIDLEWETAREVNNFGFYAERLQQTEFREIGFHAAQASGKYVFRDEDVVPGGTYVYRLRQRDYDGQFNYSPLVRASLPAVAELRAFPNPSSGKFNLQGPGREALIYDVNGRLVLRVPMQSGRAEVRGMDRGVYVVRLGNSVKRVVVR